VSTALYRIIFANIKGLLVSSTTIPLIVVSGLEKLARVSAKQHKPIKVTCFIVDDS
jgi:hypothetical protein